MEAQLLGCFEPVTPQDGPNAPDPKPHSVSVNTQVSRDGHLIAIEFDKGIPERAETFIEIRPCCLNGSTELGRRIACAEYLGE